MHKQYNTISRLKKDPNFFKVQVLPTTKVALKSRDFTIRHDGFEFQATPLNKNIINNFAELIKQKNILIKISL